MVFFPAISITDLPIHWPSACVKYRYAVGYAVKFFLDIFFFTSFWLHVNWTASLTESEFRLDWILLQRTIGHHIPRIQRIFVFRFHFDHTHTRRTAHSVCHFSFSIVHWFIRKLVSASSKTKSHWNYGFSSGRVAPTAATNKNIAAEQNDILNVQSVSRTLTISFSYVSHGICVERPYVFSSPVLITKRNNDRQKNVGKCEILRLWFETRIMNLAKPFESNNWNASTHSIIFLFLPMCTRSSLQFSRLSPFVPHIHFTYGNGDSRKTLYQTYGQSAKWTRKR